MRADLMLEALTERTEVESECGSEQDVPSPPRRTRRRESGFIRIPALSPELLDVMDTGCERVRDEEGEVEGIVMDAVEEESEGVFCKGCGSGADEASGKKRAVRTARSGRTGHFSH